MTETIAPGVYRIALGYVNAYLIDGDEGVTLIDTGLPRKEGAILGALAKVGRDLDEVAAIVITHAHVDHVGSAAVVKRATGAPLYASAADAPAIRGEVANPTPPFADRVPFLKPLIRLLPGGAAVDVDHVVGESETSTLPGDLEVVDTPGHTPGHRSYVLKRAGGVMFVGDAAVATKAGEVRRGWMNRSTPDFDGSVAHLATFDFDVACFGHSAPIRTSAAAAFRRFVHSME